MHGAADRLSILLSQVGLRRRGVVDVARRPVATMIDVLAAHDHTFAGEKLAPAPKDRLGARHHVEIHEVEHRLGIDVAGRLGMRSQRPRARREDDAPRSGAITQRADTHTVDGEQQLAPLSVEKSESDVAPDLVEKRRSQMSQIGVGARDRPPVAVLTRVVTTRGASPVDAPDPPGEDAIIVMQARRLAR